MTVKEHKESFDNLYRNRPAHKVDLDFPLAQIDALDWHRGPWGNAYYGYFYRRFTCHILSRLNVQPGQKVLIVGCGFGLDEKNIKALCSDVELWSVDISQEMIRDAVANRSPSRFAVSQAEALPFKDNSFDRVLSREVIEHVMEPKKMVCEIARVLKPGALAVITTENEESLSPKNFYEERIREPLGKLFQHQLVKQSVKDEAPTLRQMNAFVEEAQLELSEYFWDGALYKSLLQLRSIIKFDVKKWAHWFSRLENNRALAFRFCDQVKYIVRKPATQDTSPGQPNSISHVCPSCHGDLTKKDQSVYRCQSCGHDYPIVDGIPNLIVYDNAHGDGHVINDAHQNQRQSKTFGLLDSVIRKAYSMSYFLAAAGCANFTKNNQICASRLLRDDEEIAKYLPIPKKLD